jgi:hypothetical protein
MTFEVAGYEVVVESDPGLFELTADTRVIEPGLEIATLTLESAAAATPPPLVLRWSLPAHDVQGIWTTGSWSHKTVGPDWSMSGVSSMFARNAPVLSLFGSDDGNRLTVAVSDGLNTVRIRSGIREEDATVRGRIELFSERQPATARTQIEIRFDRRQIPLRESLAGVSDWWAAQPGYEPATVPELARLPMYSTWYSYHQSVSADELLGEVELAKELGYEAIIVDDGWQTLDSRRGYAFTGDWEPERIPAMVEFVDDVHERGMKILLWYAMPLVGENSKVFPEFLGKYLRYWDGQGAWVLDPRYPEVREHLIGTYRSAMLDWGVDGFKLDFLGFFVATWQGLRVRQRGRGPAAHRRDGGAADGESRRDDRIPAAVYRAADAEVREHVPGGRRPARRSRQPAAYGGPPPAQRRHGGSFGHVHVARRGLGRGGGAAIPECPVLGSAALGPAGAHSTGPPRDGPSLDRLVAAKPGCPAGRRVRAALTSGPLSADRGGERQKADHRYLR